MFIISWPNMHIIFYTEAKGHRHRASVIDSVKGLIYNVAKEKH